MKAVVVGLIAAWVILVIVAHTFADRMMFLPPPPSYSNADLPVVRVPAEDGAEVAVLHLVNPAAAFTVIYAHGNAEDLGDLGGVLELVRAAGFSVLAFDYRGYGLSGGGRPTANAVSRDMDAVYRYAREQLGVPHTRLVVFGRSIGTGPAVELAARQPVAGLVIESGFVSAFRVATRIPLLPFDRFPNLRLIGRVQAPVLVIHGVMDEVIPVWHGRRLFAAAPEPKRALWVDDAGHNDLVFRAGHRYVAALQEFISVLERTEAES